MDKIINSELIRVKCLCPVCGVIYKRFVETDYVYDRQAWYQDGNVVIFCDSCKKPKPEYRFNSDKIGKAQFKLDEVSPMYAEYQKQKDGDK